MATPVFCCGFECGIAAAHSGGPTGWTLVGTGAFSTVQPRTGLRALRANPAASNSPQGAGILLPVATNVNVVRVYVYFATLPSGDAGIVQFSYSAVFPGILFKAADSSLYIGLGQTTFGVSGIPVTTGRWYQIDLRVDATSNPWTIDAKINGVALPQYIQGNGASTNVDLNLKLNPNSPITADVYWDDVICSQTTADYPLGGGTVLGLVADSDGTHTCTGTNIVKGTTGTPVGAAITSATMDAYLQVNGRPIGGGANDATALINQQAVAGAEYVEVGFQQVAFAPRAVEVLAGEQQATSAGGVMVVRINDNGLTSAVIDHSAGAAGVVTDRFTSKQFNRDLNSNLWTLARFNNLKMQFGLSTDATPDQYWRGAMVEAEFPDIVDTIYRRLPPSQRMYSDG